jgi:hypothetical protein
VQVLSDAEEEHLEYYLKRASDTCCVLFAREVRTFPFEYVLALNIKTPEG